MIYIVFTDDGNVNSLVQIFYKTLNLPYKMDSVVAKALIQSRGDEFISCEDTKLDYICVESYHNDEEFCDRMLPLFYDFQSVNRDYPELSNMVTDIVRDMENRVATCEKIAEAYNKVLAQTEDILVFRKLDDLLTFMYRR